VLGIAERQNTFEFLQSHNEIKVLKALGNKVFLIGDWIQSKRIAKNLTPGHLAAKMGIAAALVRAWESGIGRPDEESMKDLSRIFGCGFGQ
jgi:ribosome-binding protein aMBF1 (putative translation factor)